MNSHHQLLHSIGAGNADAFGKLYQLFSEKVYNTALSYAQNAADAEEITQDVFTRIFKSAQGFKGKSAVTTWIYRISVNTSLNHLQKKKQTAWLSFNTPTQEPVDFVHPGLALERREEGKLLFRVIDTLPDQQKTAFILSFVEDLPRQEVAEVMELSLKAVESLLQRAKGNLRKKLANQYPNRRKRKK